MRVALASDHAGFPLKEKLKELLSEMGHTYTDFGTDSEERCDYPDFAFPASEAVSSGECEVGILVCGSGVGMSICANKVRGIRAALCSNTDVARLSRLHNNANILCLGARLTPQDVAFEIVRTWLQTNFEGGRHQRRLNKITDYEYNQT